MKEESKDKKKYVKLKDTDTNVNIYRSLTKDSHEISQAEKGKCQMISFICGV